MKRAGLSDVQAAIYAGAAGLKGDEAKKYLDSINYSRISGEAQKLGLKGQEMSKYISEHAPEDITLAQQKGFIRKVRTN